MSDELEMSGVFSLEDVQKALEDRSLEEQTKHCMQNCPAAHYFLEQIKQERIRQYKQQREKDQNSFLFAVLVLGVPLVYCGIRLYTELTYSL
ncbi:hypothetical protein KY310_04410 [Candidatus Woesearchaeota archaeon]|nr:hypothetical protein [Candidatus Woesearchaeota archaeon]